MNKRALTKDDVKILEMFFLEAMSRGWAAGETKISIPELPGTKAIPYRDERKGLYLLDYYFNPPDSVNNGSAGTTMIWWENVPIWVMHYGGAYIKGGIPFLKAALLNAYQLDIFWGGRGEPYYNNGRLVYINQVEKGSSFESFRGEEMIIDIVMRARVGWHSYWGMLL